MGIRKLSKSFYISASIFRNHNDDLIGWSKDSEDQVQWQAINFNTTNTLGIDINVKYTFNSLLNIANNTDVTLGFIYLNATIVEDEDIALNRYTLDQLNHQLLAGANIELYNDIYLDGRYRHFNRESLENCSLVDAILYL